MCFHQKSSAPVADYTINEAELKTTRESKYLGIIIQSGQKFTTYVKHKVARARQELGMIKWALHSATKNAKLLAYITLYASSVWDPVFEY